MTIQSLNHQPALEILKSLDPQLGQIFEEESSPCPELTEALIEYLYGNLYQRDQLSLRERLLVTIAILMSSGNMKPQLATQTQIALKNGIKREELMEVALQISVFCGFANAINAANIVDSVADSFDDASMEASNVETTHQI
jgi:4-carboxymuconolactone decarboxylase